MNAGKKHINARTGITLCINSEATTIATALLDTPIMSGHDDRRIDRREKWNAWPTSRDGSMIL